MTSYTSSGSGAWNSAATWGGVNYPQDGDTATIAASHIVTITSDVTVGTDPANFTTLAIDIAGTLKWEEPLLGNYTVTCKGNIRVQVGGTFEIGNSSVPILSTRVATFYMAGTYSRRIELITDATGGHGTLRMYGNEAYHMASASMQRALLLSDVAAASPATITLDRDTDYTVGDVLWLGKGGSRATTILADSGTETAGYGIEQVTLLSKIDAHTYTANLTYAHLAGDFVVHGTRNAILKGNSTKGFEIYENVLGDVASSITANLSTVGYTGCVAGDVGKKIVNNLGETLGILTSYNNSGVPYRTWNYRVNSIEDVFTGTTIGIDGGTGNGTLVSTTSTLANAHGVLDINWANLQYMCPSDGSRHDGIYMTAGNIVGGPQLTNGKYKIKNTLFDSPGYTSGLTGSWAVRWYGLRRIHVTDKDIDEIHAYGYRGVLSLGESGGSAYGAYTLGHVSGIKTKGVVRIQDATYVAIDRLWQSYERASDTDDVNYNTLSIQSGGFYVGELTVHTCPTYAVNIANSGTYNTFGSKYEILSGEILNGRSNAVYIAGGPEHVFIKNVYVRHMKSGGFNFAIGGVSPQYYVESCSFHNCGRDNGRKGAVQILGGSSDGSQINARFVSCSFGTDEQNHERNVALSYGASASLVYNRGRHVFENCTFKEPAWSGAEPSYGLWGKWRAVCVFNDDSSTALNFERQGRFSTLELVNPVSQNAAGVDQWPSTYAGITRMALVGGGGEVWNEPSVQVDGTLGIKMTPYTDKCMNAGTAAVPIKIPILSGQDLTVTVQMRKTHSMPYEKFRPLARAFGCGIDDTDIMPDTNDTWETLTLTGTATSDGLVRVWFESGVNARKVVSNNWTPEDTWHITVYVDAFDYTIS